MNRQIILKSRPTGMPGLDNFHMNEVPEPETRSGEIKLKAKFFSVDPYMRGWMNEGRGNMPSFEPGKPLKGGAVAEVVESKNPDFKKGDFVQGPLLWQEIQTVSADKVKKLPHGDVPLSYYLGILGMPGMTAYFGLLDIGKPQKGETVVVSGAAGAVGTVAGQIAKIKGCYVTGIAGTDEKVSFLKNTLHFDDAINYNKSKDLSPEISRACPKGIDVYYDNVGGDISDAVLPHINEGARIVICGQISTYNSPDAKLGLRVAPLMLARHAMMKGFTSSSYAARYPEAIADIARWIKEGKIQYKESILKGFEKLPDAFIGLFRGENTGKQLVEL